MILYKCDKERKNKQGGKYHVFVQASYLYEICL